MSFISPPLPPYPPDNETNTHIFPSTRSSPPKTDSEEEQDTLVIRPKLLGKSQAKKRLLAFSLTKHSSALKPIKPKAKTSAKVKNSAFIAKTTAHVDPIRATVNAIEEEKKKEVFEYEPHVQRAADIAQILLEKHESRSKRRNSSRRSRSKERNRRSSSRSGGKRRRSRSGSRANKDKDSEDKKHKRSKSPHVEESVPVIPGDWSGLKAAEILIDENFRRLKLRAEKRKNIVSGKNNRENLIADRLKEIQPVVDFSKAESQPRRSLLVLPANEGLIQKSLISYAPKIVHFTLTSPTVTWAPHPKYEDDAYYMPREFYSAHANKFSLELFCAIADSVVPQCKEIESASKIREWFPKDDYLMVSKGPIEPPKEEEKIPAMVFEDKKVANKSSVRERKISLVAYESDEDKRDSRERRSRSPNEKRKSKRGTTPDVRMEGTTVKVKSKWDSDYEDSSPDQESRPKSMELATPEQRTEPSPSPVIPQKPPPVSPRTSNKKQHSSPQRDFYQKPPPTPPRRSHQKPHSSPPRSSHQQAYSSTHEKLPSTPPRGINKPLSPLSRQQKPPLTPSRGSQKPLSPPQRSSHQKPPLSPPRAIHQRSPSSPARNNHKKPLPIIHQQPLSTSPRGSNQKLPETKHQQPPTSPRGDRHKPPGLPRKEHSKQPLITTIHSESSLDRPEEPQLVSEYEEFLKLVGTDSPAKTLEMQPPKENKISGDNTVGPLTAAKNDWDRDSSSPDGLDRKSSTSLTCEKRSVSSEYMGKKVSQKKKKEKKSDGKKIKKRKVVSSSGSDSDSSDSSSSSSGSSKKKKRKRKKHEKKAKVISSSSESEPEDKRKKKGKSSKKKGKDKGAAEKLLLDLQLQKQEIARKLSELDALTDKKSKKAIARDLKHLEEKISKTHKVEGLVIPKKGKKIKKLDKRKKVSSSSSSTDSDEPKRKGKKKFKKKKTKKESSSSDSSDDEEKVPKKKKAKKSSGRYKDKGERRGKPKIKSSKDSLVIFNESKRLWRKRPAEEDVDPPLRRKPRLQEDEGSGWEDETLTRVAETPQLITEKKLDAKTDGFKPRVAEKTIDLVKSLEPAASAKTTWEERDWEAGSPSSGWENSKEGKEIRDKTEKKMNERTSEVRAFKSVSAEPEKCLHISVNLDRYSPGADDSEASRSPQNTPANGIPISTEVSLGSLPLPFSLDSRDASSDPSIAEAQSKHSSILDDSMFKGNSNFSIREDIHIPLGMSTSFFHSTLDRPFSFTDDAPFPGANTFANSHIVGTVPNGSQNVSAQDIYDPLAADSDMSVEDDALPTPHMPLGLDEIPLPAVPTVSEILLPGEVPLPPPAPLPSEPQPRTQNPLPPSKPPKPAAIVSPVKVNRWDRPPGKKEVSKSAVPVVPALSFQANVLPTIPLQLPVLSKVQPVLPRVPVQVPDIPKAPLEVGVPTVPPLQVPLPLAPLSPATPLISPAVKLSPSPTASPSDKKLQPTHVITVKMQQKLQSKVAAVFQDDSDDESSSKGLANLSEIKQKISHGNEKTSSETQEPAAIDKSDMKEETKVMSVLQVDATDAPSSKSDLPKSEDRKSDYKIDDRKKKDDRKDREKERRDEKKDGRKKEEKKKDDKPREKRSSSLRRRDKRSSRSPVKRRTRSPERRDKKPSRSPERTNKRLSKSPEKTNKRSSRSPERREPRRFSRSPERRRRRSPSPRRRPRSPSPRRRRRPESPRRRRSRSRSLSPRSRRVKRRSRSRSPVRRSRSPLRRSRSRSPGRRVVESPKRRRTTSPQRLMELPCQIPVIGAPPLPAAPYPAAEKTPDGSSHRLTLDQRIELELGVKLRDTPPPPPVGPPPLIERAQVYYYPQPAPYLPHFPTAQGGVVQVGNIMEVVPGLHPRPPPPPPPPPPQQQIVQVGNVLQVVPGARATAVVAPTPVAPEPTLPPPEIEALQNPLIKAIQAEREKRRKEKEARKDARESRRRVRQAKRNAKLMSVSEKLKKSERNEGLLLGQDLEDEELLLEALEPPSPPGPLEIVVEGDLPPAGKSILVTSGFKRLKDSSVRKGVKFADGLLPGEASESGGEDHIPQAPKAKLPKEKRFKKKIKKKVKVRIIRHVIQSEEDDDDDELPPPSPPPGDPPPILYATFPFGGQVQYPVYHTSVTTTTKTTVTLPAVMP